MSRLHAHVRPTVPTVTYVVLSCLELLVTQAVAHGLAVLNYPRTFRWPGNFAEIFFLASPGDLLYLYNLLFIYTLSLWGP